MNFNKRIFYTFIYVYMVFLTFVGTKKVWAQAQTPITETSLTTPEATSKATEVGKHVMANMDAGSMILSLVMVLGLIVICALLLKRFNVVQQNNEHLKVVASLSLGPKERVVVIEAGKEQFLLGINSASNNGQITLIDKLKQPLETKKSVNKKANELDSLYKASIRKPAKPVMGAVLSLIKNKKTDSNSNT